VPMRLPRPNSGFEAAELRSSVAKSKEPAAGSQ
jgi:hypothetical protein